MSTATGAIERTDYYRSIIVVGSYELERVLQIYALLISQSLARRTSIARMLSPEGASKSHVVGVNDINTDSAITISYIMSRVKNELLKAPKNDPYTDKWSAGWGEMPLVANSSFLGTSVNLQLVDAASRTMVLELRCDSFREEDEAALAEHAGCRRVHRFSRVSFDEGGSEARDRQILEMVGVLQRTFDFSGTVGQVREALRGNPYTYWPFFPLKGQRIGFMGWDDGPLSAYLSGIPLSPYHFNPVLFRAPVWQKDREEEVIALADQVAMELRNDG